MPRMSAVRQGRDDTTGVARFALRAGAMFDGVGSALVADPLLLIEGTRLLTVEPAGRNPPGIPVVDLGAVTLLPGLIDTHVHLAFDSGLDPVGSLARRTDAEVTEAMATAARAHLAAGVTTIRDLGDRGYLSLTLRGRDDLPTILCAGPPVTTPAGHCHYLGGGAEPTEAAVRRAVREHAEHDVDVIKIMASGGTLTPGTRQEDAQFPSAVLAAAVDEAHRLGLPVTAHAHGTSAIIDALAAGVDGIEHASFWSAEGVDSRVDVLTELAERRVVIGATVGMIEVPGLQPPPQVASRMPALLTNHRRLHDLGGVFVAGTDAGIAPIKPHGVLVRALPMLHELGLSPAAALRAVTSVAAEATGLGARKGRLAPGFDADLIAVEGDPLADPSALQRVVAVYTAGIRR